MSLYLIEGPAGTGKTTRLFKKLKHVWRSARWRSTSGFSH